MKWSPDNQINASFIDISRNKWLVFYCGRLSSAQLDRWQAPKQWPIIDPHPVEQTAYQRDINDNGYKSVLTNSWLVRQKEQVMGKGIRQKYTKELTHSLTAAAFVRGQQTVSHRTPRNTCMYTSRTMSRHVWRVGTTPGQTRKKTKCMLRRSPIRGWKTNCGFIWHPTRT